MINRLKRWFRRRNADYRELIEINEMLIKAGRRAGYDLAHCSSASISWAKHCKLDNYVVEEFEMFYDRARYWQKVFNPADFGKNYRNKLLFQIDDLEKEVARLNKLCIDNNIDPGHPDGVPF